MIYDYACQNSECQHEFPIRIDASGVWESECPKCNQEIDVDEAIEKTLQDPDQYDEQA
jgi:hypothetical protein